LGLDVLGRQTDATGPKRVLQLRPALCGDLGVDRRVLVLSLPLREALRLQHVRRDQTSEWIVFGHD